MSANADRQGAIDRALRYFDEGVFEEELKVRVRYRTESQKKRESLRHLHEYLDNNIIPAFTHIGFSCVKYENPLPGFGPVLLASRIEDAKFPTVLGYGHGDVVLGQDEQWSLGAGPWEIAIRGDKLYGRGTADNKAQHTINIAALRSVINERGALGFNAKFIIEMGEEVGSPGLREVIEANKEDFSADVFIGSDGPRMSPSIPTITLGCRGAINFNLELALRDGGHHSGNWGGLIADPAIVLSHALASITTANGEIRIADWLPPPMPESVRKALIGLHIEGGDNAPQIDPTWGPSELTPAAKVYASNSFAILAMKSGNPENPVNAIAPHATAHCQLRFFAGTDEQKILPALRAHLDANGFADVRISSPEGVAGFKASRTDPDHPWVRFVYASLEETLEAPPAVIPSMGGSICNDLFTDVLELPAIWIPHSYAGCSQHAPNEHVLMSLSRSSLSVMAGLYWDMGCDVRMADAPCRGSTPQL